MNRNDAWWPQGNQQVQAQPRSFVSKSTVTIRTNTSYHTQMVTVETRRTNRLTVAQLYDGALGGYWVSETLFIPREKVLSVVIEELK
jgi:hypothetical protein